MAFPPFRRDLAVAVLTALVLSGCGGGSSDDTPSTPSTYRIGGTVTGLRGASVALTNGADTITLNADGTFTFATALASGSSYSVTVSTQPAGPDQICTISNGDGTVGSSAVTDIAVSCATTITYSSYDGVGRTGNAIDEVLLELTEFIGLRLSYLKAHLAAAVTETCSYIADPTPGTVTLGFDDADGNGALSSGDVVTLTLQECYSSAFGGEQNGSLKLTLHTAPQPVDYRDGFSATVEAEALPGIAARIDGAFEMTYTDVDETRVLHATVSDSSLSIVPGDYPGSGDLTVIEADIRKTLNYVQARYEVQSTVTYDSEMLDGVFTLTTPQPLAGFFNVYPDTGSEVFTGGPSTLTYTALPVNNAAPDATLDPDGSGSSQAPLFAQWSLLSRGYLFFETRRAQQFGGTFAGAGDILSLPPDFIYMYLMHASPLADPTNFIAGDALPVNTQFQFFFSAPFDATRTSFEFAPSNGGGTVIPAETEVNGAIVTVRPAQQLAHGAFYDLRTNDGTVCSSLTDFCPTFNRIELQTPNNLQADGAPSPAVATTGQTVALTSTRSFSTDSAIVSTHWRQTSGTAVTLTSPDTSTASFVIPAGALDDEKLVFELTVVDANGETDTVPVTAFVQLDLTKTFYYHRRAQGAAYGQTPEDATLRSERDAPVIAQFGSDNQFQWALDAGPSTPFDLINLSHFPEPLDLGTYVLGPGTNIQPWNQDPGCNDPAGQFVIREIVHGPAMYEVASFAADYEVVCPDGLPPIVGSVRVNSTVPLP